MNENVDPAPVKEVPTPAPKFQFVKTAEENRAAYEAARENVEPRVKPRVSKLCLNVGIRAPLLPVLQEIQKCRI